MKASTASRDRTPSSPARRRWRQGASPRPPAASGAPDPGMTDWVARRCLVSGRVQGVYYRASTRNRALALGVTGYARNLPDGRVEVLACGEPAAVAALCDWLWQGSPASHVASVDVEDVDPGSLGPRPA